MTGFVGFGEGDHEPLREDPMYLTGMDVAPVGPVARDIPQPFHRVAGSAILRSRLLALTVITLLLGCPIRASEQAQQGDSQQSDPQQGEAAQSEPVEPPSSAAAPSQVPPGRPDDDPTHNYDSQGLNQSRIFGVLPNYSTVERNTNVPEITTKSTFQMFALGSFDPYVFPFVAFTAGLAQLGHDEPSWGRGIGSYGKRYAMAFSDNAIGNLMTTAVAPTLLRTDPRYFVLGEGGFLHRAGYALSRSVVTRTRSGQKTFNLSEIGGNLVGAGISNAYHPREDRTVSGTMGRWGMQVMWDTLTNELKEFWPDIRRRL
jgi:hypothetical protein